MIEALITAAVAVGIAMIWILVIKLTDGNNRRRTRKD